MFFPPPTPSPPLSSSTQLQQFQSHTQVSQPPLPPSQWGAQNQPQSYNQPYNPLQYQTQSTSQQQIYQPPQQIYHNPPPPTYNPPPQPIYNQQIYSQQTQQFYQQPQIQPSNSFLSVLSPSQQQQSLQSSQAFLPQSSQYSQQPQQQFQQSQSFLTLSQPSQLPLSQPPLPKQECQPPPPEYIQLKDWFMHITGVPESTFRKMRVGEFIRSPNATPLPGHKGYSLQIRNSKTNRVFECGTFGIKSLSELRADHSRANSSSSASPPFMNACKFVIVTAEDPENSASRNFVDVANLQADPANSGCMFQVASNFNGVEGASEDVFPNSENFATDYIYDNTQGPAASISAGPSAISRVYGAFYDPSVDPSLWAQTARRQCRMLENVPGITVANGYAVLDEMTSAALPLDTSGIVDKICVGVQEGAQVTYGRRVSLDGKEMITLVNPDVRINQVFCAALNMRQGDAGVKTSKHPRAKEVAECVLRAAYEGSYLAAIGTGSPRLFLTMLGGGAFGNPADVIFNEIVKAHVKYAMDGGSAGNLREVVLVLYKRPNELRSFVEVLRKNRIPLECRVYRNGIKQDCEI